MMQSRLEARSWAEIREASWQLKIVAIAATRDDARSISSIECFRTDFGQLTSAAVNQLSSSYQWSLRYHCCIMLSICHARQPNLKRSALFEQINIAIFQIIEKLFESCVYLTALSIKAVRAVLEHVTIKCAYILLLSSYFVAKSSSVQDCYSRAKRNLLTAYCNKAPNMFPYIYKCFHRKRNNFTTTMPH